MSNENGSPGGAETGRSGGFSPARLVPVVILVAGAIAFFWLDLDQYVTFEALREHHDSLKQFVADNPVLAPLVYMAVYALAVAFSLPGGAILSITGGFLFGAIYGCTACILPVSVIFGLDSTVFTREKGIVLSEARYFGSGKIKPSD